MSDNTIGLAISGGGHRAALFGLGALLYLVDAGKGAHLGSIASVSGGSLTNAHFGAVDLTTATPSQTWEHAKTLAGQIVRRGTLWASPLTYVYLASMPLLVVAAVIITCVATGWVTVAAWVGAIALCGWLSQQRSAIAAAAFDTTLLHSSRLCSLNQRVSHVICASDIQTGQAVFFSGGFVYSWRTGWGIPGQLRTARAVQASAALPGAFTVVSMKLSRFGLPETRVAQRNAPKRFALLDGGVYDNMGSEWFIGMADRLREGDAPAGLTTVSEVVVVNGSAGEGVSRRLGVRIPVLGELISLLAVKDVMYRQTTAVRRRLLDVRYRIARSRDRIDPGTPLLSEALAGTTVQIDRSPFALADAFAGGSDDYAHRASEALSALGAETRDLWSRQAASNRSVPTTLSRIEAERAEWLIRHGYALTMVNCHIVLGYPLLQMPDPERISELVAG